MDLRLQGKVALVAASSRGLGRAAAEALAAEGCDLIMCARGEADLNSCVQHIVETTGVRVVGTAADLSDPTGVDRVVASGVETLGRVDILVTNTGGPPSGPFESHTPEAWREAVAQNLDSVVNLCRTVLPGMKERGFGRIINVTSIAVKQPVDGLILSNSVRAAVTGFAKSLANEVASFGITVNNVLPGYTRTERLQQLAESIGASQGKTPEQACAAWESEIPARRLGEPEELAALIAFLASERAGYITGTSIPVDGGWIRSLL